MPLRFDQPELHKKEQSRDHIGISDAEIVQLVSAQRLFGFWRMELDTGHFFATEDVHAIFDLPYTTGPANLVELLSRIHEEDRILITQTFEHASLHKVGFHYAYRVDNRHGGYKMVRSIGRFRNDEIFGVTYEFVEPLRIARVEDNSLQP